MFKTTLMYMEAMGRVLHALSGSRTAVKENAVLNLWQGMYPGTTVTLCPLDASERTFWGVFYANSCRITDLSYVTAESKPQHKKQLQLYEQRFVRHEQYAV